jgi:Domain of unknown function (DUF4426)
MIKSGAFSVCAALTLAACGQPGTVTTQAEADDEVLPATESIKEFGDYVVYFNAVPTDALDAEIAAEYQIVRSKNRVLLNIVMEYRPAIGAPTAVRGVVKASATNLNGQLRNLLTREISEADAIYYIAETQVVNGESLIFMIEATPESTTTPLEVRFQKQFFVEE